MNINDIDEQRKLFLTIMNLSSNKLLMLDYALRCAEVNSGEKQAVILRAARQHLDEVMDWTKSIYANFHAIPDSTVLSENVQETAEEERVH